MGGGVSSLPAEVTLAEAKELAGARWQPAWEEKFAEAKISRDEAVKCWKDAEAKSGRLAIALQSLGLGLGLIPAPHRLVPGDFGIGVRELLLSRGLPPGARQLLGLGKRDLLRQR